MFSACLRGYPAPAALAAPMVSVDAFADIFSKSTIYTPRGTPSQKFDDTNMHITKINNHEALGILFKGLSLRSL
jgi:hypothetical protein